MNTILSLSRATKLAGLLGALGAAAIFSPSAHAADIHVGVNFGAPPPPRHEVYVERDRPGPDYVWVNGYWAGEPGHYTWVAGRWDRPPHRGARWVEPRWETREGHYVFHKGYWNDHDRDDHDRYRDERR